LKAAGEHDVITNHGKINGKVYLHSGNDIFNGKGGTSLAIFCGSGDDHVTAGKGSVDIHVGSGNNTLTGGPGHDHFVFDHKLAGQIDKITNFNVGADKIVLSEKDFAGLGPHGTLSAAHFHLGAPGNGHAQIDYFKSTGVLEYCPDGNGGPAHVFATLTNHASIGAGDFSLIA
jgi:Ca2+-binding RTX toxin-like protein